MLVEAAMDALKANGINKVALVVFDRNKDGNAFWEKVGLLLEKIWSTETKQSQN
jgi:hypothetical protein